MECKSLLKTKLMPGNVFFLRLSLVGITSELLGGSSDLIFYFTKYNWVTEFPGMDLQPCFIQIASLSSAADCHH